VIGAESLPNTAEFSYHHRVLYRVVLGAAGATTSDVHLLYEAVAPVAYYGTTETSVERRWRRKLLCDLRDAGFLTERETPRGGVWLPAEDLVGDVQDQSTDGATIPERHNTWNY